MIKNTLLNQKSKSLAKLQRSEHVSYKQASDIGILYNAQEFSKKWIEKMTDHLKRDKKKISALAFSEHESDDLFSFCNKDVSMLGNLNKKSIGFFTDQTFDFLISLDASGDVNFKYVLALSQATCKIGISKNEYNNLLAMSVKPSENQLQNVRDIIKYLKMI